MTIIIWKILGQVIKVCDIIPLLHRFTRDLNKDRLLIYVIFIIRQAPHIALKQYRHYRPSQYINI